MKKLLLNIIFISLLLYTAFSCNNNPVIPPEDQPGRRDYEWTVDTINTFNPLYRLWGSSPTDIWAITTGTFYEDIYHFDGSRWITGEYILPDPYSLHSIYGFAKNDIYIGAQNRIYRFDGNNWKRFAELTKDGHSQDLVFNNIWGESSNDFYAFGAYPDNEGLGNNSVIVHFKNDKSDVLNTEGLVGLVARLYKNKPDNKIYLQVIKYSNSYDSTFIYEYNNGTCTMLYGTVWADLWAGISIINNEVYFILKNEITKRVNNQFQNVLNLEGTNFYHNIWGRNSKDIFLQMSDGLAHYDGTDIKYLFKYNLWSSNIFGAALFEEDVFFVIFTRTNLKLIYHGKLKKGG